MRVLGIDPGAYGALALLVNGKLERVCDMPILSIRRGRTDKAEIDGYTLGDLLRELAPDIAFLEQVGGQQGQAAGAAFNFGRAAGAPEYALKTLKVRVEPVPPGTWKKALRLNSGKDAARAVAMKLWPAYSADFKRKGDDGRAEAALIAHYGFNLVGSKTDVFR